MTSVHGAKSGAALRYNAAVKYYPLFMDLAGRHCLVVGAGAVAARKARTLLDCGARVTVVGVQPATAFRALERRGVVVRDRRFRAGDVGRQALIIAATDDCAVNAAVAAAARRKGIPVNAVDDPEHCSFIVPAVLTRGDLTVAISTGGRSPAAARLVKERISELLGDEYAALVRLLGAHRGKMQDAVAGQGSRARAWKRMIDDGVLESLRCGDRKGAAATVRRCLADASLTEQVVTRRLQGGVVRSPIPVTAEGWRGGEVSMARTGGSAMEVRSDRTPQPARKRSSRRAQGTRGSRR